MSLQQGSALALPSPQVSMVNKSGQKMYKIDVFFPGVTRPWEECILAAAPTTHKHESAFDYGECFSKPRAPASKSVTLLLGHSYSARSGITAAKFAREHRVYVASPYHVLAAIEQVSDLKEQLNWDGYGPGILVPKKAKGGSDNLFCLWYADGAGFRAKIYPFNFNFGGMTLCAFVTEPWASERP